MTGPRRRPGPLLLGLLLLVGACADGQSAAPPAPSATTQTAQASQPEATASRTYEGTPLPTPTTVGEESTESAVRRSGIPLPEIGTRSARLEDLPQAADAPTPVGLRIEALDIDAEVVPVGVDEASGEMAVPPNGQTVAWYQHGSAPGEKGSAVLAAHVDYADEPGVFFALADLEAGAEIVVSLDDGSELAFEAADTRSYAKEDLPVQALFDGEGAPVLTLITCGGDFDSTERSYDDNIVVTAAPS